MEQKIVKNDLFDYENRYIFQYEKCFKFSLDSILLAEFVEKLNVKKTVLDLCTGNAAIPLILTTKVKCHVDCVELQKSIYDLGKKSIEYNNLNELVTIYNVDAKNIDNCINNKKYNVIICNPPYFKVNETSNLNDIDELTIARHEVKITLEDIFFIASNHLDDKGEFYLVHKSERIDDIINYGIKYNLRIKKIQFIKSSVNKKPSIVLIKAVKNSSSGIIINDIINIENLKTYKDIFREA